MTPPQCPFPFPAKTLPIFPPVLLLQGYAHKKTPAEWRGLLVWVVKVPSILILQ